MRQKRIFPDTENHLLRVTFRATSGFRTGSLFATLSDFLRFNERIIITLVFNQVNEWFRFQPRRHLWIRRKPDQELCRTKHARHGLISTRESCRLENVFQDVFFRSLKLRFR